MAQQGLIEGIIIGVFVIGVSAVLCPWLAHELIAPFIIDKVGMHDELMDLAITVGVMLLLSVILWKIGLTWGNVADAGGIWGILAGMLVVAWAGSDRVIFTGVGLVASWVLMYLLNRRSGDTVQRFPVIPFLYIAVFTATFIAINVYTGDTESMWEKENYVWVVYMPIFLVVALPMVSKGGFALAEVMCAIGTAAYLYLGYLIWTGEAPEGMDEDYYIGLAYFLVFTISGFFVAYNSYRYGREVKPERYCRIGTCCRRSCRSSSRSSEGSRHRPPWPRRSRLLWILCRRACRPRRIGGPRRRTRSRM
jgi:hypothetical protein